MGETDIGERIRAVEESAKQAHKRIDRLEEQQSQMTDLIAQIRVLTERVGGVQSKVESIDARLAKLEQQPAGRWEAVIKALISAAIGAGVTYIATRL